MPDRRLGYIPDSPALRAQHESHHVLLARSSPVDVIPAHQIGLYTEADLPNEAMAMKALVGKILDQSWAGSCVAQALAKGLNLRLAMEGTPVPPFAALGGYTLGRAKMRAFAGEKLRDEGTMPSAIMMQLATWGIPFESVWPYDIDAHPELVFQDLPVDVLQDSVTHVVTNTYRVNEVKDARLLALRKLLLQNYPVPFGTYVSDDFQRYGGGVLGPETKTGGGGHDVALIGYSGSNFCICNSWGDSWGEAGFAWVNEAFIVDDRADDFYALLSGPKVQKEAA